ncbi:MAG TPA: thioredoxin family protein [Opitutus sp.]|nr:thioredoxin family protein [Opitutus sp.]
MKKRLFLALGLVAACTIQAAVKIGDSYEEVIAEKGAPGGEMNARGLKILVYPEITIKLKGGKVVSLEAPKDAIIAPDAPADEPAANSGGRFRPAVWTTNYDDALKQAKEENRHVFVFFTGSDWCGWCHRLRDEVLATPEFQTYAREKLILVELDFPRKKSQPAQLKEQNSKLAGKFGIRGYPTVVILNSRGKQIDSLGYQPGGPGPFIERLRNQ